MDPARPESFRWPRWTRWVLAPFLGVFALPWLAAVLLFFILPLGLWSWGRNYFSSKRLTWRMARAGRRMSLSDATAVWIECRGSFILDTPTFGWAHQHLWWTPADLAAVAPPPPEKFPKTDCDDLAAYYGSHPFTLWCLERHTHRAHGDAVLVRAFSGRRVLDRIRRAAADGVCFELCSWTNDWWRGGRAIRVRPIPRPPEIGGEIDKSANADAHSDPRTHLPPGPSGDPASH